MSPVDRDGMRLRGSQRELGRRRLSGDPRGPSSPTSPPSFAPVEAARGEQGQAAELICRSPRGTSAARR